MMDRVETGRAVRARLLANPAVLQVPGRGIDLFIVRGFLDADECRKLCARIDAQRQPSAVLGPMPEPDFRTSESCNLRPSDPLVVRIEARLTDLIGIDPAHGESVQGQRYAVGQRFKAHYDFFFTDQAYWQEQEANGGQRTWTAMMFLNEPGEGGQTAFERAGLRVTPKTGTLLAWNNLYDSSGEPNAYALHEGMPVLAGTKYIITKWYRERPWGPHASLSGS